MTLKSTILFNTPQESLYTQERQRVPDMGSSLDIRVIWSLPNYLSFHIFPQTYNKHVFEIMQVHVEKLIAAYWSTRTLPVYTMLRDIPIIDQHEDPVSQSLII